MAASRKVVLGPRPGQKIRSGVVAPKQELIDLSDSEEEGTDWDDAKKEAWKERILERKMWAEAEA